jgi:phenylacetate-CoA ligase
MQIVVNRLKEKEIKFNFPIIFFTSENITWMQKELFTDYLGKNLNDLYGSMDSPSLGIDFGLMGRFVILPNSNLFQFGNIRINKNSEKIGNVIITNLLNTTMPIIRYALNDLAEIDEQPNFGVKYINKIVGRQDDILKLNNGKELAHHHAHEMFMDFHECQMFKFVQKTDKTILLQLKIANDQDRSHVQKLAHERWIKRFGEVPLLIEFVDDFKIDPQTGKFKNIEIE